MRARALDAKFAGTFKQFEYPEDWPEAELPKGARRINRESRYGETQPPRRHHHRRGSSSRRRTGEAAVAQSFGGRREESTRPSTAA